MTTLALTIENIFSPHTDRGLSTVAQTLRSRLKEVRENMSQTETLGKSYRETLDALHQSYAECSSENWDGYRARAVTESDLKAAIHFLETLPTVIPPPEISVEPDGEFAFEWYRGPHDVLSVSIGRMGRLSFAARIGRRRRHGTEYFADELPTIIAENLERLFFRRS